MLPSYHRDASAWLAALDAPTDSVGEYRPRTLKQILEGGLAVGAAAGRLQQAMRLVADIERRLAALARNLAIDRRSDTVAGAPAPPVAIVSAIEGRDLLLPGRWVPGLAAAAGARAVDTVEGGPDTRVDVDRLVALAPDVVIVALADRSLDAAAQACARVIDGRWRGAIHAIDGTNYVNQPGPAVLRSIELIAYAVHGGRSGVTPEAGELVVRNAGPPE